MSKTSKSDDNQATRRAPSQFPVTRVVERTRIAEPNRIDHPSRDTSPSRHHEPARREQ